MNHEFISSVLRLLLVGTEQGAQLRNLMEKIPTEDILTENFDPPNQQFVNDYLSVLRLRRTYEPFLVRKNIWFVVEMIFVLQRVGFFKDYYADQSTEMQLVS